jgi:thiol-disulfide isomerase/thioredoxin
MKKLLLFAILFPVTLAAQGFKTTVRGTVTDSRALYVIDIFENHNTWFERLVPVIDGRFEYTFEGDHVKRFHLVKMEDLQRGSMRDNSSFYPDADVVEVRWGGEEDFEVRGGALNAAMDAFDAEEERLFSERKKEFGVIQDSLEADDNRHSDEAKEVYAQLHAAYKADAPHEVVVPLYDKLEQLKKERRFYSPAGQKWMDGWEAYLNDIAAWELRQMAANPDLHSYAMLVEQLKAERFSEEMVPVYAALAAAHPGHPYGVMAETMLSAHKNAMAGAKFIDFTLPTIDGTEHKMSSLIAGKVAVIHFWASWCGPCIIHGHQLVPLLEKYAARGFTVAGVAREYKNTEALKKALAYEKFPWTNLVEMDDSTNLWAKYGIRAAGAQVLIDENGTIVNPNATVAEIEKYLDEHFR